MHDAAERLGHELTVVQEVGRLPTEEQPGPQHDHLVREVVHGVHVVGHEEDRLPELSLDPAQGLEDDILASRVDVRRGFVEQEHLGSVHDRPGDQDPLDLSSGEHPKGLLEQGRIEADRAETAPKVRRTFHREELPDGERDIGLDELLGDVAEPDRLGPPDHSVVGNHAQ